MLRVSCGLESQNLGGPSVCTVQSLGTLLVEVFFFFPLVGGLDHKRSGVLGAVRLCFSSVRIRFFRPYGPVGIMVLVLE